MKFQKISFSKNIKKQPLWYIALNTPELLVIFIFSYFVYLFYIHFNFIMDKRWSDF